MSKFPNLESEGKNQQLQGKVSRFQLSQFGQNREISCNYWNFPSGNREEKTNDYRKFPSQNREGKTLLLRKRKKGQGAGPFCPSLRTPNPIRPLMKLNRCPYCDSETVEYPVATRAAWAKPASHGPWLRTECKTCHRFLGYRPYQVSQKEFDTHGK